MTIAESTSVQGTQIDTKRTIDPATFTTLAYAVTTAGPNETIDLSANSAAYHYKGKTTQLDAPAAAHRSSSISSSAGSQRSALMHATTAKAFNVFCICPFTGFEVKASAIVPATEPRPAGVPATDAEAAFDLDDGIATIWYDPATFVLHELDVPSAKIRIVIQT